MNNKRDRKDQPAILQKMRTFGKAFLEYLGRPKTIFDIKDRLHLFILLVAVIAVLETVILFLKM